MIWRKRTSLDRNASWACLRWISRHMPCISKVNCPHVRFVVRCVLVAHPGHQHDVLAVEHRQVHVPLDRDVALGIAFLQRIRGRVVVGDHRLPLPDGLAPQAGLGHFVDDRLVLNGALGHGALRPGVHGQNGLVVVGEGHVADLALGQPDALFQREHRDLVQRGLGHLVQLQQGLQTLFIQTQLLVEPFCSVTSRNTRTTPITCPSAS